MVSEKHFNRQVIKATQRGALKDKLVYLNEEGAELVFQAKTKIMHRRKGIKRHEPQGNNKKVSSIWNARGSKEEQQKQ